MQNYKAPGDVLDALAPYDVVAGEGALVGGIFGVACDDALSGAAVRLKTEGVFEMEKTSAQAWAVGERIYWNDSTKKCENLPAAGMYIGLCTEVAANPTAVGKVKLSGKGGPALEGAQAAVADLAGTLTGTADGTMVDVAASAAATAGGATPSAAQVDTGIATAVATIVTGVNTQNKEVLTKINAILAALRLYGIIAP